MRMRQALNLVRQMGPRWVIYRAGYSLQKKTGWLERKFALSEWSSYCLDSLAPGISSERLLHLLRDELGHRFFIHPGKRAQYQARLSKMIPAPAAETLVEEAEAARCGEYRFFSGIQVEARWPPPWHRHPETCHEWPKIHWSHLPDMGGSDVKWLWELGRFGIAYTIVRAYWLTGEPKHAETFWKLVESWRSENPPNFGVHWMCGQECSFRVLAWCFALFGLLDAPATTPERVAMLVEMLAAHGERIEGNLGYAVSQKNNHSISEALALWTLGTLLPMLGAAPRWEAQGRRLLEQEAKRQIYGDGSYVQHTLNYHRLILQSYAWALRLGELSGRPFSAELYGRYRGAARFLYQLTDEVSGCAPNYGSNDGVLLFRFDSCDFNDYRPTLALAFWVAERRRVLLSGCWDEALLWLCGEEPFAIPVSPFSRVDLAADTGGYYTLVGKNTWGFTRSCVYRDRPAQADMLHVDLWWRGANLIADPGTYSYNSPPPWNNSLSRTDAHNTVQVDGLDQMERGPRFTWFYWARGRVIRHSVDQTGRLKLLEGEHDGYQRRLGITHRRVLLLVDSRLWVIVDDLKGDGIHRLSSHWLFPGAEAEQLSEGSLRLTVPVGTCTVSFFSFASGQVASVPELQLVRGSTDTTHGWFSHRYLHKESALSVITTNRCPLPVRMVTWIALVDDALVEVADESRLIGWIGTDHFTAEWIAFPYDAERSLVHSVKLEGGREGQFRCKF